ncbi:MAG: DUF6768 family protein [Planctomycetota bacterium]|jgi:uncharacterized membrane protein YciS (DUF1049 family)
MNELDKQIREALRRNLDEAGDGASIDSIREMVRESFRGKSRAMVVVTWGKMLMFLAFSAFAAVQFFQVDDVRSLVGYAVLFLVGLLGWTMMWQFHWMLLNRNSAARELKRLELQVAELVRVLGKD